MTLTSTAVRLTHVDPPAAAEEGVEVGDELPVGHELAERGAVRRGPGRRSHSGAFCMGKWGL
jgi:hypothetical protein